MPEKLDPKLASAPLMSQENFNSETIGNIIKTLRILNEKQRKYKNAYNKLLHAHASTGASSVGIISGISTTGTTHTHIYSSSSTHILFICSSWSFSVLHSFEFSQHL